MTAAPTVSDVRAAIALGAYRYADELELHRGIEAALHAAGLRSTPEVRLTPHDRIDFLVDRVGVEVKVKGTRDALHRQLLRYAASPRVDALLVVTTIRAHRGLPGRIGGKPVHLIVIGGVA
jgi:hypothetical protein